jgi:APA family basic amino acid/polyamine antiporter
MLQNSQFVDARSTSSRNMRPSNGSASANVRSSGGSSRDETAASIMTETRTTSLARRLGPLDAAAIIVSNVIGAGILLRHSESRPAFPILGSSSDMAGGRCSRLQGRWRTGLAALRPHAGGIRLSRAAYGPLAGFLTGWTSFVAGFTGAMAASAVVLVFYLDRFIPGVADATPFFVIPLPFVSLTFSRQTMVAIAAIVLMASVHLRGVGPGRLVSNVLATLKVTALLVFIALGFSIGVGSSANLQQSAGSVTSTEVAACVHPVDVHVLRLERGGIHGRRDSRSGKERPARARSGHRSGHRDLPAAQSVVSLRDAGRRAAKVKERPGCRGREAAGGARGNMMGIVSIISLTASINAYTFVGPRCTTRWRATGFLPGCRPGASPVGQTPAVAIVAQAVWASVLVLSGSAGALTR